MSVLYFSISIFLLALIGIAVIALFYILMGIVDHIRFGVLPIKTPTWVLDWFAHNVYVADGSELYDLGCGDATVLTYLERAFPKARMTGIEGAFIPLLRAKWNTKNSRIAIKYNNFYTASIHNADIVFCNLSGHLMARLERHLKRNLKKGAEIYSYAAAFPTWKPTIQIPNPQNPEGDSIFKYTKN